MKRSKSTLILLILISCFSVNAQQSYKKFEHLNWLELQEFQSGYLYSSKVLALVESCPQSLSSLRANFTKFTTHSDVILGYQYYWTQFYDQNYDWCLVKHNQENTLENKSLQPVSYENLTVRQAQVLLSAREGFGFKEKGYGYEARKKKRLEIIGFNRKIAFKKYKKHGGKQAVYEYMKDHKPALTNETLKMASKKHMTPDAGPYDYNSSEAYLVEYFERAYSNKQRQSLIDKKNSRKYTKNHLKLLNKQWLLTSYQLKGDTKIKILDKATFYLKLDKDTYELRGSIDCNNFHGSYQLKKNKIIIKQGATTLRGCLHPQKKLLSVNEKKVKELLSNLKRKQPYYAQTKNIRKLLRAVYRYKVSKNKLKLFTKNGDQLFYKKIK